MYQGLEVGQLTKLDLQPGGKVTGEMTVDPSVVTLLRDGTRIELRSPKLSLSDANISSLLTGKTFELVHGTGEPRSEFVVVPVKSATSRTGRSDVYPDRPRKLRHRCRSTADPPRCRVGGDRTQADQQRSRVHRGC